MAADRDRPLSPHLQIYRLPLNAITSITHRITGVLLCLGAVLLVIMLITLASGSQAWGVIQPWISGPVGWVILFGFTLVLYYHLCAGVRHLFWDAGYGYELQTARRASWWVIAGAAVLTLLTWAIACFFAGG